MTEDEIARQKAGCRVKLLIWVLIVAAAGAGFAEWRRSTAPLSSAVLVYQRAAAALPAVDNVSAESKAVIEMAEKTPDSQVSAENAEIPAAAAQSDANSGAVAEFLAYLRDVREDVDGLSEPEGVLMKIRQPEAVQQVEEPTAEAFKDGQIEIYDSEKGVVGIVEAPVSMALDKADIAGEAAVEASESKSEDAAMATGADVVSETATKDVAAAKERPEAAEIMTEPAETVAPDTAAKDISAAKNAVQKVLKAVDGEAAAERTSGESEKNAAETPKDVENTTKKDISDEEHITADGAIDMMKAIAERQ